MPDNRKFSARTSLAENTDLVCSTNASTAHLIMLKLISVDRFLRQIRSLGLAGRSGQIVMEIRTNYEKFVVVGISGTSPPTIFEN